LKYKEYRYDSIFLETPHPDTKCHKYRNGNHFYFLTTKELLCLRTCLKNMSSQIRNIGILAHVDAGKTSVTENFLFLTGAIKSKGSVDDGTTQTDFLDVEKERGITVQSASTYFEWNNNQINLIDTPGHVDFSADLERTMRIIDGAILIVSAVEGVQAHTLTIWNALKENNIPTLIFVNKIDRVGSDIELVSQELTKELQANFIQLHQVENEASDKATIISEWNTENKNEQIIEAIANVDEEILEKYLDGINISFDQLNKHLKLAILSNKIYPILCGSAKNNIGIRELLDFSIEFLPSPKASTSEGISALVYKIEYDKSAGKITHVKIISGTISNRDVIFNQTQGIEEKVTQVRKNTANKFIDIGKVEAGSIAGICGFKNAKVGDILGEEKSNLPAKIQLRNPLLTVQVKPVQEKQYFELAEALQILSEEDPMLDFDWVKEEKELHVKIMGWIQIEVFEKILSDRFNIEAKFEDPSVIYKETPKNTGEGFVQYWMPKPCWAIMKFKIEPGKLGSGVTYESKVSVDKIHKKYQNEVEKTILTALKQGIKGWEVTDIKITLIDGEDHEVHSRPGDFIIATPMGIMNGLTNTNTTLLEPLISFKISAPEELLGAITSDIIQMRGTFESPTIEHDKFIISGILPVSTSLDFPVRLSSRSGGKAKISTNFHGYQKCTDELGIIRPFKGISPLDTAKYILKARKALQ
jgi:ribosomal protection tetracycline resistance protein